MHYRDGATAIQGVYVHDDRLGPYAFASLSSYTLQTGKIVTALNIRLGGFAILKAIIVPLPKKVRLPLAQVRFLGHAVAQAIGKIFPKLSGKVVLNCRYRLASEYRTEGYGFRLTRAGAHTLVTELVLSRYVGVIELGLPEGPMLDVLIDSTETQANPSVLACVRREAFPHGEEKKLEFIAARLGARRRVDRVRQTRRNGANVVRLHPNSSIAARDIRATS